MALLEVTNIKKIYSTRFGGNKVQALSNVSFSIEKGNLLQSWENPVPERLPSSTYWHLSTARLPEKFSSKEKYRTSYRKRNLGFPKKKPWLCFSGF